MTKENNHKCLTSKSIFGHVTFGTGELDNNGFWEFPCFECAEKYKQENPEEDVWPAAKTPLDLLFQNFLISLFDDDSGVPAKSIPHLETFISVLYADKPVPETTKNILRGLRCVEDRCFLKEDFKDGL